MSRKPKAIFDYDDTLGAVRMPDGEIRPVHYAYKDCIERFGEAVATLGFDKHEAIEIFSAIDADAARKEGFGDKTRFGRSMSYAYHQVSEEAGRKSDRVESDWMYNIGMSVFTDYPYVPLPGALDVLEWTAAHYEIAVVTKGEYDEQYKKLRATGVVDFVDPKNVFILGTKGDTEWWSVLFALGVDKRAGRRSWAIGNSLKADVNPPLRHGLNGIWLHDPHGWSFEHDEPETPLTGRQYHIITDIREVPSILPVPILK